MSKKAEIVFSCNTTFDNLECIDGKTIEAIFMEFKKIYEKEHPLHMHKKGSYCFGFTVQRMDAPATIEDWQNGTRICEKN